MCIDVEQQVHQHRQPQHRGRQLQLLQQARQAHSLPRRPRCTDAQTKGIFCHCLSVKNCWQRICATLS